MLIDRSAHLFRVLPGIVLGLGILGIAWTVHAQGSSPPSESAGAVQEVASSADEAADATSSEGQTTVESTATPEAEAAAQGKPLPPVATDASGGNFKLRAIQERVNELKEKIFQSKARLIQLQEVVLHGTISGAKAVLMHKNEMGSSFRMASVRYFLDGAAIFNRVDNDGDLDDQDVIEIFNGSIAPGNHQISVYLEYKGHGFGVFSYLKGYTFKITSSYTFTAEEGKVTTINIVGYEKGGIATQLKDRPSVRYDIETARELRRSDVKKDAGEEPVVTE